MSIIPFRGSINDGLIVIKSEVFLILNKLKQFTNTWDSCTGALNLLDEVRLNHSCPVKFGQISPL